VRSQAGTSLVEFAIIAPVFVFLAIGIIEIGRYTFFAIVVSNAARAGVQYGSQNTSTAVNASAMASAALADAEGLAQVSASPTVYCENSSTDTATTCPTTTTPAPTTVYYVKVVTTGTFKSLLHYPGIPNNVPITGSAIMRVVNTSE